MRINLKRNDLYLLLATCTYSLLFYGQTAGINFLLFTCLLLLLLFFLQTDAANYKHRSWRLTAAASLLTAISIVVTNSDLAISMNLVSLVLVTGFSFSPRSSLFIALPNALYSVFGSWITMAYKRISSEPEAGQVGGGVVVAGLHRHHLSMVGIPVAVCLLFLCIYASASQAFSYVLSQISFDFISWGWVFFTLSGFLLLYGFFRPMLLPDLTEKDLATSNTLFRIKTPNTYLFKLPALHYEYRTCSLLLVMLNLLLLLFILIDGYYLTFGTLPGASSYKDFLHHGVYALILSILLAIGILLYVFRGNLNFYKNNQKLKQLAYLWLALNVVLVLLTLSKNCIYVYNFGLTYKRIGVYTYLTLTIIGLIFSFVKVARLKNNWYLFRQNTWALYTVMLLLSLFSWDRAITYYNLNISRTTDYVYLSNLSDANLPELLELSDVEKGFTTPSGKQQLVWRQENFVKRVAAKDWQSWNYNDWRILQRLKQLEQ